MYCHSLFLTITTMKLGRLAGPLFATALSACTQQQSPTVEQGSQNFNFQAQRNCPTDSNGNPTTGIENKGVWSVECTDKNGDGLIDLVIENRASLNRVCHTPEGTKDNC